MWIYVYQVHYIKYNIECIEYKYTRQVPSTVFVGRQRGKTE